MPDPSPSTAPVLSVVPGAGVRFDPATSTIAVSPEALAPGGDLVVASSAAGIAGPSWRISIAPLAADPTVALDLGTAAALAKVSFLGTTAPAWTLAEGAARLVPAPTARTHGVWSGAGGDGLYRCLFRLKGGLSPSIDRRFTFGARIRFTEGDWSGLRVEPFETSAGRRYLHVREYTGTSGATTSLATIPAPWSSDTWQWLEVKVEGTGVSGRIYPEGAAAPDWQVTATTHQVEPGGFGPGAFPAGGVAPTADIRRLEFVPAA